MPVYLYSAQGELVDQIFGALDRIAVAVVDELFNGSLDDVQVWARDHRLDFDPIVHAARSRHTNGRRPQIVFSNERFELRNYEAERALAEYWHEQSLSLQPTETETLIEWRRRADASFAKFSGVRRELDPIKGKAPHEERLRRRAEWFVRHRVNRESYEQISKGPPAASESLVSREVQEAVRLLKLT